jgi:hypothetical protein
VPWWTWLSLGFLLAVVVAGAVVCGVWALRLWRPLRDVGRAVMSASEELTRAAAEIERRAAAVTERSEELEESLGRLAESRRRLTVLTREIEGMLAAAGRVTSIVAK